MKIPGPVRAAAGVLLALVLIAGGVAGLVGGVLLPRLNVMLKRAVAREFSLPEDAKIEIRRGSVRQTLRGFLPRFEVESPGAVIDGVPLKYVSFRATRVDFNMRRILRCEKAEITSIHSARTMLRVSRAELERRIVPLVEKKGLSNVVLEFGDGFVKLSAKRKIKLLGSIKLSAKGRFIVDGSDRIVLKVTELESGQINVGVSGLGLGLDETLPVLDLGGMFAQVAVDDVLLTTDYLQVTASAKSMPQDGGENTEVLDAL